MRNQQGSTTYYPGPHQLGLNTGGETNENTGGGGGPSNDGMVGQYPTNFLYQRECTAAWCTGGKDYPGAGEGLSTRKNYHLGDNRPCVGCVYQQK